MSSTDIFQEPAESGLDWRVFPALGEYDRSVLAEAVMQDGLSSTAPIDEAGVGHLPSAPASGAASTVLELIESALCDLVDRMDAALAEAGEDPAAQLRSLVEAVSFYVFHRRDLVVLEQQVTQAEHQTRPRIRDGQLAVLERFSAVAERGVASRQFDVVSPTDVARSIIAMVYATASWHDGTGLSNAEVAAHHAEISCAMVGAPPDAATAAARLDPTRGGSAPGLPMRPSFMMRVQLSPLDDVGDGPYGRRLIFRVLGGTVTGSDLTGTINAGGADWMLLSADGHGRIDARVEIVTDDGAILYVNYPGVVDFRTLNARSVGGETTYADHYYRCTPRLETGHSRYQWVNERVFISRGRMAGENLLEYEVFVVE